MGWLLLVGGIIGAWAMLNVLCAERERRVQTLDINATARRQAAERAAERARKQANAHAAAAAARAAAPTKPAN